MINRFSPSRRKSLVATAVAAASLAVASNAAFAVAPVIATANSGLATYTTGSDTFAIGTDGHIRELTYAGNAVTSFDVTASLNAIPAVYGSALSSLVSINVPFSLLYVSADGHVHKLSRATSNNAWSVIDISALAGAKPVGRPSQLASISLAGGHYRAYYIDASSHIEELADTPSGGWVVTDLSVATGTEGAVSGSSLTALAHTDDNSSISVCLTSGCASSPAPSTGPEFPRVYYFNPDGRVQELAWGAGAWHLTNIGDQTGATPAVPGSALTSFEYLGTSTCGITGCSNHPWYPRVYYFDNAGHVHEMAWGDGWHATDVSAQAGAVAAAPGSAITSFAWQSNDPKVYYFSADGHVRELQWYSGWRVSDISALTCAPAAASGSSISGYNYLTTPSGVAYFSADNHIHTLVQTSSWQQQDLNGVATPQGCTSSGGGGGGGGGTTHPER